MRNTLNTLLLLTTLFSFGQDPANDWYLGPTGKTNSGIAYYQALKMVKGKTAKDIVVAVIDGGVDIDHVDLRNRIWINEDEIPDNGVDDDNNGYIDDVYGWNFIGSHDTSVTYDNMELTRQYAIYREKYRLSDSNSVENKVEYRQYLKLRKDFMEAWNTAKENYEFYKQLEVGLGYLEKDYGTDITREELENHESTNLSERLATYMVLYSLLQGDSFPQIKKELLEGWDEARYMFKYAYNIDFNSRDLVGDDFSNPNERFYGNKRIFYDSSFSAHGTHVAGIIAAVSDNDTGAVGICQTAKIMCIRVVPKGDERDKDVANGIYYAVDNGAQIINMSFGKGYAHRAEVVKAAIAYAQSKGVLLVHGAGNDGENIDEEDNFPNDFDGQFQSHWIEVGASSWQKRPHALASFSNYGATELDVFAPGVDIYSTTPGDHYDAWDGTSMASPVVAGVAAFIWSYYPELTADEVRAIILDSATPIKRKQKRPGFGKKTCPDKLSVTGGVVNLSQALILAEKRSKS